MKIIQILMFIKEFMYFPFSDANLSPFINLSYWSNSTLFVSKEIFESFIVIENLKYIDFEIFMLYIAYF